MMIVGDTKPQFRSSFRSGLAADSEFVFQGIQVHSVVSNLNLHTWRRLGGKMSRRGIDRRAPRIVVGVPKKSYKKITVLHIREQ